MHGPNARYQAGPALHGPDSGRGNGNGDRPTGSKRISLSRDIDADRSDWFLDDDAQSIPDTCDAADTCDTADASDAARG